jgi:hypothetical protein
LDHPRHSLILVIDRLQRYEYYYYYLVGNSPAATIKRRVLLAICVLLRAALRGRGTVNLGEYIQLTVLELR